MAKPLLIIGTKSWSSWSLRPWLAIREAAFEVEERVIPLRRDGTTDAIHCHSPSGKVPVLVVDGVPVVESLAICELVAEAVPGLWPADPLARAVARAASAEMHAGFAALRRHCPMDVNQRFPRPAMTPAVAADLERLQTLWRDCRDRYGRDGPFLFGRFSIADAMFAPVASRFVSYDLPRDTTAAAYIEAVMALASMRRWCAEAALEEPLPRGP